MAQNYDFLRSFTIDGKETKHLFQIAKLNIPFLSKENEFFQVGNTDGKNFRNTRLGDYTLSIDGFIIKDNTGKTVPQVIDELKALVNSDEPQKLVFDIFPDRYFNAIFTGAEVYDATDLKYTPLTLTFDVPDGLAHQIEPNNFTNVYSTGTNLVLDSEFNNMNKYLNSWVLKLDEKYNGSNIIRADFTNGYPVGVVERNDQWLYQTPRSGRRIGNLKQGDSVSFSVYARVNAVDSINKYAGSIVLDEYTDGKKNGISHFVRIPNTINTTFVNYGEVVQIVGEKTNGIGLQLGAYGLGVQIDFTKPMMSLLPPLAEKVVDPNYYRAINYVPSEYGVGDVIRIENNGTYRSKPTISFVMNGENGLVGLVNENGSVLQFGNPEDVDTNTTKVMEYGLNENLWGSTLPSNATINSGFETIYPYTPVGDGYSPNTFRGSWTMNDDINSAVPVFSWDNASAWHGPTMVFPIKADSNNQRTEEISSHTRFIFNNKEKGQRGRIEFALMDLDGNKFMSAVVRDSTISSNQFIVEFWHKDEKLKEQFLDRKKFNTDFYEMNMDRLGDTLVWRLVKVRRVNETTNDAEIAEEYKFNWTLPSVDKTPIGSYGVWCMRYQSTYAVRMGITDINVKWNKTSVVSDIKNFFQDGDIVDINTNTRQLFVNGVVNNKLNVVGNQWEGFTINPGNTMIQPIVSSWANMADVFVEFRETYL